MDLQARLRNPAAILAVSLAAALLFTLLVITQFEGSVRIFWLYYHVPISIPFVAFAIDRGNSWARTGPAHLGVDVVVLVFSLLRAFMALPLISGHTLFLAYALLSTDVWAVRLTAALVLLEVVSIKVFIWHDPTLVGGLVAGGVAAVVYRNIKHRYSPQIG